MGMHSKFKKYRNQAVNGDFYFGALDVRIDAETTFESQLQSHILPLQHFIVNTAVHMGNSFFEQD